MKKGELLVVGNYLVIYLGRDRLKEKFDDEGFGGLFVPQARVVISQARLPQSTLGSRWRVGNEMWIDRKRLKRMS